MSAACSSGIWAPPGVAISVRRSERAERPHDHYHRNGASPFESDDMPLRYHRRLSAENDRFPAGKVDRLDEHAQPVLDGLDALISARGVVCRGLAWKHPAA
jgi:hypothetical protein